MSRVCSKKVVAFLLAFVMIAGTVFYYCTNNGKGGKCGDFYYVCRSD